MADQKTTRWTVTVSQQADLVLRKHLAQRGLRKGDLSKFVEDAVKWRVLDQTVSEARSHLADLCEEELQAIVDEAVDWARSEASVEPLNTAGG
jgi:hypothetical protein